MIRAYRKNNPANRRRFDHLIDQGNLDDIALRGFTSARDRQAQLESAWDNAIETMRNIQIELATSLGIASTGNLGLTPDTIKFNDNYRQAKSLERRAFTNMRNFNGKFQSKYKREIAQQRSTKLITKGQ